MPFDASNFVAAPRVYKKRDLNDPAELALMLGWVRDDLRSGAIPAHLFNMADAVRRTECGTVACIGGHAALYAKMSEGRVTEFVTDLDPAGEKAALERLFYPSIPWGAVTPALAADAIDNYLTLGEARWADLYMSESPAQEGNG